MARLYVVDYAELGLSVEFDDLVMPPLETLVELSRYAVEHLPAIRPGDLIKHVYSNYRNESVCIWSGDKFINLESDYTIDDYGYVPRVFEVDDDCYTPDWWAQVSHNTIFWFHPRVFERLHFQPYVGALDEDEHNVLCAEEPDAVVRSELLLNGKLYNVFANATILNRIIHPMFHYSGESDTTLMMTDAGPDGSHFYTFI